MRFIIYGAGGIGGVIGAQLFTQDQDVVLIARGQHLEAMRARGLRYQTPFEDVHLRVPVARHPRDIEFRPGDVVVLTMKSQHTAVALDELRATAGDALPIVCCQNGVANERAALRRFVNVYAMLVYLPAQLTGPGEIQCHARLKPGVLDVGVYPSGIDPLVEEIAARLEAANFSAHPDPTVMRFKYAKLLMNLRNGLEAIAPPGDGADEINAVMKAEGEAAFRTAGIDYASDDEVRERRRGVFEMGDIEGVERLGGSSRQSLLRRAGNIEADYLNGEIALLGRLHDVATPANMAVQRLANELARMRGAAGSVPLETVREAIGAVSTAVR